MNAHAALKSYLKNEVTACVENESPEKLILMLLQKGCVLLKQAKTHLDSDSIEPFHEATTHCMQIVVALRGLLDFEGGGEVAIQLATTYDSINASIFKAKRERSGADLEKLYLALSELKEAWGTLR